MSLSHIEFAVGGYFCRAALKQTPTSRKAYTIMLLNIIKRVIGSVRVHSFGRAIRGYYSEGRRDLGGKDWVKEGY